MKLLFLTASLLFGSPDMKESVPHGSCTVTGTRPDATAGKKEAFIELTFICPEGTCANKKLAFTKNGGKDNFVKINSKGTFVQKLSSGEYEFEFKALDCYPVRSEKIKIESQTRVSITVEFEKRDPMIKEEKPVIYLYPETKTGVTVQLSNKNDLSFTYPAYGENGWSITANPDGTLESNGKQYNYLFWEGETALATIETDFTQGFIVHSDTLTRFLEHSLALAGLNTKESADFITYWAPRMVKNQYNYVHFIFTTAYDQIAKIKVSPQPDAMLRVYLLWHESDGSGKINPQIIPSFTRKGFTVVEWGGSEIPDGNGM